MSLKDPPAIPGKIKVVAPTKQSSMLGGIGGAVCFLDPLFLLELLEAQGTSACDAALAWGRGTVAGV